MSGITGILKYSQIFRYGFYWLLSAGTMVTAVFLKQNSKFIIWAWLCLIMGFILTLFWFPWKTRQLICPLFAGLVLLQLFLKRWGQNKLFLPVFPGVTLTGIREYGSFFGLYSTEWGCAVNLLIIGLPLCFFLVNRDQYKLACCLIIAGHFANMVDVFRDGLVGKPFLVLNQWLLSLNDLFIYFGVFISVVTLIILKVPPLKKEGCYIVVKNKKE